ncbi:hypothetical protein [Orientia tsutsugamushi]|nr:Uncharacterised protein [Orientia tsutsugamushi]
MSDCQVLTHPLLILHILQNVMLTANKHGNNLIKFLFLSNSNISIKARY